MSTFKEYQNIQTKEIRPYVKGEDLTGISITEGINPEKDKGYVARDPNNHEDQWYITKKFFKENFAEVVEAEEEETETPEIIVEDPNRDWIYSPYQFISGGEYQGQSVTTFGFQTARGVAIMTVVKTESAISNDIVFLPEAKIVVNEDGTKSIK